jgi:hypothetical protein
MDAVLVVGPPNGKIHYYHVFKEMAEKLHVRDTPIVDRSNKKKKKNKTRFSDCNGSYLLCCRQTKSSPRSRRPRASWRAASESCYCILSGTSLFRLLRKKFICVSMPLINADRTARGWRRCRRLVTRRLRKLPLDGRVG